MNINGNVKKVWDDLKSSDLKTNGSGSVVWKLGIKSILLVITILGFGIKGVLFYAQTADTTKAFQLAQIETEKNFKDVNKKVQNLQIEKTVNDTISLSYFKFIVRKLESDQEKAGRFINEMEKQKAKLISELKEQLKNDEG